MKKLALHWKIIIGLILGIIFGLICSGIPGGKEFTIHWIKPFGTIFVNLLKLIAMPLIMGSLIKGVADLKDISKFKSMGIRTVVTYIFTTIVAIVIGLTIVNVIKPGEGISSETVQVLKDTYAADASLQDKLNTAAAQKSNGPLQFVEDIVPSNIIHAMSNNKNMLQVIVFTLFLGFCLLLIDKKKAKPLRKFFDSLNEVVLKMIDIIMLFAPYAVFALLASVIVTSNDTSVLMALLKYALVVIGGLALMIVFYSLCIAIFLKKSPLWFLKNIAPAQLLAFSTSSSAATLPITMERVEEHLGVKNEVASFVLPVGATINMDGTSLYQAVAAVFIMQVLWPEGLIFENQITIIITALLASIGSAAVPGAGMVMLIIVLDSIGFPKDLLSIGLALIFAVDRPLDMLRTTVNVTGDATVALLVNKHQKKS
ncbi:dicarboxylate/amino acid:cation symporter [Ochrovirga pacifica]|uniref:dicarboxylate/amino acid:cation symporter n=1 Tax=Ochrovirga pacifica TaxID=1042376 RepID=UPI0002557BB5|nr:dicarboxylate/amino acid:cation symporter [Ochrovirga pacifica]